MIEIKGMSLKRRKLAIKSFGYKHFLQNIGITYESIVNMYISTKMTSYRRNNFICKPSNTL